MTDTEQRIAIAKACGWKEHYRPKMDDLGPIGKLTEPCWYHPDHCPLEVDFYSEQCLPTNPPDYLNSLDAMHEAEKTCLKTCFDKQVYCDYLMSLVPNRPPVMSYTGHPLDICVLIISSTARQRAKALLRTLNLGKS